MPTTNLYKRNKTKQNPPKSMIRRQQQIHTSETKSTENRQHDANDKFTSETKLTKIDNTMPTKISLAPETITSKDNNSKR
ncbi:2122_t:CDS:2 [Racocetra persica]|uniref:2122_t:CDS:1 n=1 Tax=Racocetra persica TaxID=160502 RepID=A0ACA9L3V7_9GLOM|nr:2122_t:CDS:2 [Racocetra persica]